MKETEGNVAVVTGGSSGIVPAMLLAAMLATIPIAHSQEVRNMSIANHEVKLAQHLIDLHFEIWNDPDPRNWAAKFSQVYATGFYVADHAGVATGYENVGKRIQKVHGEHAGFRFTPDPVSWNHGVGRVTWGYGPANNPNLIRGEDIFTIKDGKLASARVFVDKK
jgi:hypothetical protein